MKIAIDLLWVKPKKSGGIESYIRNLLNGFLDLNYNNEYILILSKDNERSFDKYFNDIRFKKIVCNIDSNDVVKRIVWQNIKLNKLLLTNNISLCFEPIYSKPFFTSKKIKFITTIHDLQVLHYPEYFSKLKYYWMKYSWNRSIKTSEKIVAISNFVKEDIMNNYSVSNNIEVIYNPIVIDTDICEFKDLQIKYDIDYQSYYYTVAQLLPHKNLETLIKVMKKIKCDKIDLPQKLLITGINGKSKDTLTKMISEYDLEENVILTGFVDDKERNALYKNCKSFLFSSVFEGFGMPPVEAMLMNVPVISTNKTSICEVTQNKASYVIDPYNIDEWINKMIKNEMNADGFKFDEYNYKIIAKKYLRLFNSVYTEV